MHWSALQHCHGNSWQGRMMQRNAWLNFETVLGVFSAFCFLVYSLGFLWSGTWFPAIKPLVEIVESIPLADLVLKRLESLDDSYPQQRFLVTIVFLSLGFTIAGLVMFLAGLKYDGIPPFNLNGQSATIFVVFCAIGVSMFFFPSSLGTHTRIGMLILESDFIYAALGGSFFFALCLAYFFGHHAQRILKHLF